MFSDISLPCQILISLIGIVIVAVIFLGVKFYYDGDIKKEVVNDLTV